MARTRLEAPAIKTWDEANEVLAIIVAAENAIDTINIRLDENVAALKMDAEEEARPHKELIKKYELQLKEFAQANKSELNGKSKSMTFGKLGFRLSTKLVLPKCLDNVIKALRKEQMDECIIVKESVNKDAMKQYSEEQILKCGGSLKKEDVFFYETNHDEISQ